MTLGRQLVLAISLMFLLMLMGVELIYLDGAKRHLQNQLESHAQDAATSLGLSLGILVTRERSSAGRLISNRTITIRTGLRRCTRCTGQPPSRSSAADGASLAKCA
jgi:hypothetical protein